MALERSILQDQFGRTIDYLRVSVTDRCDMRCDYCMPKSFKGFEEPQNWLQSAELTRLVSLFTNMGVSKVRLTGGEPLLRRSLIEIVRSMAALPGVQDLSLSTNGAHLIRHAKALKHAGLHRINISLDTLDKATFERITQRDALDDVLRGIQLVIRLGFDRVKLNMVVQHGINDAHVEEMLVFAVSKGLTLRLIETMPVGHAHLGKSAVNLSELAKTLAQRHGLIPYIEPSRTGPATYWQVPNTQTLLGVITPMSQHFCGNCNRLRLGVDGTLYPCLGQNDATPLGRMLRAGHSDAELTQAIVATVDRKPERHDFHSSPERVVRFMSATGG